MPRRRFTCLASPPVTSVSRFRRRVRVDGFFSRMWFMKALRRMILPVPVILKRLAAPLSVFILGIGSGLLGLRRRFGRSFSDRDAVLARFGGCCGGGGGVALCDGVGDGGSRRLGTALEPGLGHGVSLGLGLGGCLLGPLVGGENH